MILREYQQKIVDKARIELSRHNSICIQLATGGGKTPIMASICNMIVRKGKTAWIIVPRTELLQQASSHLLKWNVPHGIIAPGRNESRAFKIHVVSKDTLIRRYGDIKIHPDLIIIDECHIALDRQIEITKNFPKSKIIGMTGTPERLDGRGLSELYETWIEGPSYPWLIEHNFLSKLRYFAPPIDGLKDIHKRGTEYVAKELDELLERKKIYGKCIEHYREYADGKTALVFCRDVKSAYETADRFCDAGYKFFCIEGKITHKRRKELINALSNGDIHGLTNCEIATYGLDVPRVEVGIGLRPTLSRALYFQMIGRCIRPFDGKEHALFFDHVNNLFEHSDPANPGIPPHLIPNISWNFFGTQKSKRKTQDDENLSLRLCPECFLYFEESTCPNCGACAKKRILKPIEVIENGKLSEIKPIKLRDRDPEEKREYVDRINNAIEAFQNSVNIEDGAVGDLLEVAEELGNNVLWVYWKLTKENRKSINVPLLHEIARQKKYKAGWAWYQAKKIRERAEINY